MMEALRENGRLIPPAQLKKATKALRETNGTEYLGEHAISESDESTGFKVADTRYIGRCVSMLAELCKPAYRTRICKALFVGDFLAFEGRGEAITGLGYTCMQHGPVPANYRYVFQSLEELGYINMEINEHGRLIKPNTDDYSVISQDDLQALGKAAEFVNSFSRVEDLSDNTHELVLWSCRKEGEAIMFESGDEVTRLVESRLRG
jgi:hypothetical protein